MQQSLGKILFRVVLPIAIVAAGFMVMKTLIMHRKAPKKVHPHARGILVQTVTAKPGECPIEVWGTGTVRPREKVDIVPEVSGKVIRVSPRFVQGGIFSAGEELFRLEPLDYEVMLEKAKASLAGARLSLEIEKTRGDIARKEWNNIKGDDDPVEPPLTLRKPQLKQAEAALAAAEAELRLAAMNLERTRVRAPFNCVVKDENIDPGQYLKQGTRVGSLTGTDVAEIVVPVSIDDLEFLKIPGIAGGKEGAPAEIRVTARGRTYRWHGKVARMLGDVDPKSRMFRVVVEVPEPFSCRDSSGGCNVRLSESMFVDVIFQCGTLHNVYLLRRDLIRSNDSVWIMDSDNRLRIREVNVLRYQGDKAIVDRGIEPGEKIVATSVTGAADGMLLRTAQAGRNAAQEETR